MKPSSLSYFLFAFLLLPVLSFAQEGSRISSVYFPKPYVELKHPAWSSNAVIYQANVRQYTPEGTFRAFEKHLPRLKELGVDIIWLMPVQPVGVKNRKGTLGSEYSVRDYYAINPEFGTMDDFKALVKKIHSMGMHVILDWVGNHSSWDNALATQHPDWYTKTPEGRFQPTPWYDWDDVIDFDYDKPAFRKYMTDALKFWVRETDIDGYRCDVAGFIPVDFWDNARKEMDKIKPVFMLAEWESRDLYKKAFDMTYSWSLYDKLHSVTVEKKDFAGLVEYMAHDVNTVPRDAYRMTFTDNHDKNSWTGTPFTMFGDGLEECIAFTCVVNGMPLVYGGQEAGNPKQLRFFDKDTIEWKEHPFFNLYKSLFALKHRNQALWNGAKGGEMMRIVNDRDDRVLSFAREKNGDRIVAAFNFSDQPVNVRLQSKYYAGSYLPLGREERYVLSGNDELTLKPWGYIILEQQKH